MSEVSCTESVNDHLFDEQGYFKLPTVDCYDYQSHPNTEENKNPIEGWHYSLWFSPGDVENLNYYGEELGYRGREKMGDYLAHYNGYAAKIAVSFDLDTVCIYLPTIVKNHLGLTVKNFSYMRIPKVFISPTMFTSGYKRVEKKKW